MNKYLKNSIAIILSLTLLLFFNNVLFYDFKINAYAVSTMDEEIADQEADEKSVKYKAGDWKQAKKDGCAANFFHNAVQDYLTDKENGYGYQQVYTPSRRSHLHGLSEPLCRTLRATSTEGRATMQKVV